MFPLHLAWDAGVTAQEAGVHKLPLGKGSARKVVVTYPSEAGGYTPGDTWDLYLAKDGRLQEIVLQHAGPGKPIPVTWGDQKKAGPLLVSLEKRGTVDGKPLHIFYTNVAVKLAGSSTWMDAQ